MKATFKPLSLAVAVAAASAGYAGIANAQTLSDNSGLGDLAIVPYYTVQENYATGIDVINTSNQTQVVKLRLRRAIDSMDALDFNVILSPNDVWTGFVEKVGDEIHFVSNDNSCTAPAYPAGQNYFVMPNIYAEGAEEGYIEVIGMGAADASQPISQAALHKSDGVPFDCDRVRDNFFWGGGPTRVSDPTDYGSNASPTRPGVISSVETRQYISAANHGLLTSRYTDTGNVLKVSFFIKNDESGTEFGNDAVHIADFMTDASITNQKFGVFEGDLQGFDHPDLNGGAPLSALGMFGTSGAARGSYEPLRTAIGASAVVNDWSRKQTDLFSVDTDWVITVPGQYLMTNLGAYLASIAPASSTKCLSGDPAVAYDPVTGANCDFRDIPLMAQFTTFDREEQPIIIDDDDLVVSPAPPLEISPVSLQGEVNVIEWGQSTVLSAVESVLSDIQLPADAEFGWASLSVTPSVLKTQAVCEFTDLGRPMPVTCTPTTTPVPLVGFVAWQRNFANLAEANYGRIVEHSYIVSSAP